MSMVPSVNVAAIDHHDDHRATSPKFNDPSLKSTWSHRVWVATGCTTISVSLAISVVGSVTSHLQLELILALLLGYLFADLASGVYHWAIDNYGDASTPIFGSQINAFQGHHKFPYTIVEREFANKLHMLGCFVTFLVLPMDFMYHDQPLFMGFVGMASGCLMFSQQFHAWAHETKNKLPVIVVVLQDIGVLLSRSQHVAHHKRPFNNNYCIVSGVWNRFLDDYKVFEALEMMVFLTFGVQPRSSIKPNYG
ncbi:fatty acid desaturase 4, chloroplastic-like [Rutidosis leptorrhynchoides]|uniref:fatty acid desaturase 4, chloroplastic-like n=1 Tax=Rutidosis leptorrhynchoides TaxID=125765 RepID=UPI003A99C9C9